MKKITLISSFLVLAVVFSSCLLTIHPIYTEKDVVYDASLTGKYKNTEKKSEKWMQIEQLISSKGNIPEGLKNIKEKGYRISFQNANGVVEEEYIAFMVILNNDRYMDMFPVFGRFGQDEFYKSFMIPMHGIFKLSKKNNNSIVLQRFDQGFLQELLEKRQIRLKHEKASEFYSDDIVITAGTAELQAYILKYGKIEEAYDSEESATYQKL